MDAAQKERANVLTTTLEAAGQAQAKVSLPPLKGGGASKDAVRNTHVLGGQDETRIRGGGPSARENAEENGGMLTWTGLSFSCCSWGSYGEDQDIAKHIAKQMQSQKIADEAMRQNGRRYYGADGKLDPVKPPKVKSMSTEEELCGDLSRPPQSLLEASLRRVYLHKLERVEKEKRAKKNKGKKELLDVERPKQPEIFLDSFLQAVKEGVKTWADEPAIANILDKDIVLTTQDKQTFRGKVAVIRRLNTGMAKLLSVMEQYKGQDFPDIQKEGPTPTEQGTWTMTYTLKRGIMKFRLQDEFTIEGDVVTKLVRKKL